MEKSDSEVVEYKNNLDKRKILYTSYFLGIVLLALILTELLFYSQNNLLQNNQWIGEKRMLKFSLLGSDEFLLSRSTLSKNQLDLSTFWGYQAVKSKKKFIPKSGSFDFLVPKNSYLDFQFILSENKRIGIRLNNLRSKKIVSFIKSSNGEFSNKLYLEHTLPEGWSNLQFFIDQKSLKLFLNSIEITRIALNEPLEASIGFHAGITGAIVDNIFVEEKNGMTFKESFRFKTKARPQVVFIHGILMFLLIEILTFLSRLMIKTKSNFRIKTRLFFTYQFIMASFLLFLFDFYYLSSFQHFNLSKEIFTRESAVLNKGEYYRFDFFRKWALALRVIEKEKKLLELNNYTTNRIWKGPLLCTSNPVRCLSYGQIDEVTNKFSDFRNCNRIIFLGTSQTVGAGASDIGKTIFAQVHESISNHQREKCLVSLNLAISGSNADELFKRYKDAFKLFSANLMVINLSNNDVPDNFGKKLSLILDYNKGLNTKSILVKEANSIDHDNVNYLRVKHEIMNEVGHNYNVPILPFHSAMSNLQNQDLGMMWWDFVHLTDFGQKLASDWLSKEILKIGF
ncbi:MAG: SGNH/GDSL hydrolase family protein [Bacteriovoracaceae bacterium]|nr:SGNH/GDSL hydrolase family protein [Bacteriovoracaceae bacterium]